MRFRIRRCELLVATTVLVPVAIALAVAWRTVPEQIGLRQLEQLRTSYVARVKRHADLEREYDHLSRFMAFDKGHGTTLVNGRFGHVPLAQRPELVPKYVELTKYHASLREKYERAAANPRLTIPPDPPEPPVPE